MTNTIRFFISCLMFIYMVNSQAEDLLIRGEVWADNWFTFYSGNTLVVEDSDSIRIERSFNSETFTFVANYPLVLNFILKDFKENDTGLEYIGTRRQQLGDGGFIAQFTDDNSDTVVAVTDSDWRCKVIQKAPLDKSCKNESNPVAGKPPCEFMAEDEPDNWKSVKFDDSQWKNATEYSARDIRPKDGFNDIDWYSAAKFIWSGDIEEDNTVLCRLTINSPDELKTISQDRAKYAKTDRDGERHSKEPPPPPDGSRSPPPPRR